MPQYTRMTTDYFIVQVYRGGGEGVRRDGWVDLHSEMTSKAAYAWVMSYRRHLTRRYRIVKRRK